MVVWPRFNPNEAALAATDEELRASALRIGVLLFKRSTQDERREILGNLLDGICRYCYRDDPDGNCQCWNDE